LAHPILIRFPLLFSASRPVTRIVHPVARPSGIPVGVPVYVPVTVDVNVDVSVPPIAMVVPGRTPEHPPGEADSEGDKWRSVWIVRIPRIINRYWIGRHVDDLRVCWHYLDDLFGHVDDLRHIGLLHDNVRDRNDLLVGSFKGAYLLSLGSEVLDGVHHFFRLINESLAEIQGPSQVLVHFGDQLRELRDGLDVLVPGLLIHFWNIVGVSDESRGLNYFDRIGGRRQDDGDERIWMEGDGLGQFLEFGGAPFGGCGGRWCGIRCGG
jgi:hypothetical protein